MDEWNVDNEDLESEYPLVYVINLDDNSCSEFGTIGIKQQFGGLVRTC